MVNKQIIRPSDKTTIQISRKIKEDLTKIGKKGETYSKVIERLVANFKQNSGEVSSTLDQAQQGRSMRMQIGENISISKYQREIISIKGNMYPESIPGGPIITLEVTYNKPIKEDDNLYQIDLKIEKIIFNNEVYSPKEFFGVLQKDIVYNKKFLYFYFSSVAEIIKIEFKRSSAYFLKKYEDYFDISRWRTFLLNTKLSPEILSSDVESMLSDMKNEKTNQKLVKDVSTSFYEKLREHVTEYDS